MQNRFIIAFASVLAIASSACTKSESETPAQGASATAASTPVVSPAPSPSASATAVASAAPSAEEADSATTAKSSPRPDAKKMDAGSSAPAASASAAPAECGTKPLPDCPLQGWMKANANTAVMTNDLPAVAIALDKIVTFAPPGYTNWSSIAKDGAAAARSGDLSAAKASCRSCHDQYKQKYKTEMRSRKI